MYSLRLLVSEPVAHGRRRWHEGQAGEVRKNATNRELKISQILSSISFNCRLSVTTDTAGRPKAGQATTDHHHHPLGGTCAMGSDLWLGGTTVRAVRCGSGGHRTGLFDRPETATRAEGNFSPFAFSRFFFWLFCTSLTHSFLVGGRLFHIQFSIINTLPKTPDNVHGFVRGFAVVCPIILQRQCTSLLLVCANVWHTWMS